MNNLISQLRALLGAGFVLSDPAEMAPFETDWRRLYANPALAVVFPENTAQVAAIVRLCAEAKVAVVPQGGNTGLVAGAVPVAGVAQVILNLRRMTKIRAVDLDADTITVESGLSLQALQEHAAASGRLFPVSLAAEGSAQIGGVISTNAGGIQVLAYGSMRAQVLGLEVVLADGQVWNGLRALRKDNTGFELKQVFIGAEGLLGIITAATLRLHPAVGLRATAFIGIPNLAAATRVFSALRAEAGAGLTAAEFMTAEALSLGLAHLPAARLPFQASNYILVEISATNAAAQADEMLLGVLETLIENGTASDVVIAQSERERQDFWRLREALSDGELAAGGAVKHDIAVPVSDIPATVEAIEAMMGQEFPDLRLNIFGHIGDGNLHVNVRPPAGHTLADIAERKAAITSAVETLAVRRGGSFSAEHGIGQMRVLGMQAHKPAVELEMMRKIKQALDPQGLFNPGKMLP